MNIPGYTFVRQDRLPATRGGGVGLYISNDVNFRVLFGDNRNNIEQLWVEIEYRNRVHAAGLVYRSPSNREYQSFFNNFEETLIQIHLKYESIICFGDFNFDFLKPDNRNVGDLLAIAHTFNLKQIVAEPTRISGTSISILDLIFTNDSYQTESGTIELNIADHRFVYSRINCGAVERRECKRITYRDFTNIDRTAFQHDLRSVNWNIMYTMNNVDEKVSFLTNNILRIFEKHAPLKTFNAKHKYAPWITPVIKTMQRLRDRALTRFKRTQIPAHWDYYKQLRNYTNRAIDFEKKAYLKQKFKNCSTKQKWQELKKLNVSKKKISTIPGHLADANLMNNFFVDRSLDRLDGELVALYESACLSDNTFSFQQVNRTLISSILLKIKTCAIGSDKINIDMINICCPFLIPHITHVINNCLELSIFPQSWKMAHVAPLPKINNPTEFSHLRSISILPTLSKVLERVMELQMKSYIDAQNVLPAMQSGFRSGYNCTSALCNVTDDIFRACDDNQITVLVLLDYSRAFDTINHRLLLSIFKYIGFGREAVKLMNSYLSGRSQAVVYGDTISDPLRITKGVPQGSILGPLAFTIYTSFHYKHLKTCKYHLYADDTQLYCSFPFSQSEDYYHKINLDLKEFYKVSVSHNLKINPEKSSVVLFGSKLHRDLFSRTHVFSLGGESLPYRDNAKNLGIVLDCELRFRLHVTHLLRKAYMSLKIMYPHRRYLPRSVKIMLCDSLVLSHFSYCDTVYGPCLDSVDSRRIQKVQNSCLRFIYGIKRPNRVSYKLSETKWLCMHSRRQLHTVCFFYKILVNKSPPYLFDRISFRTDVHNVNIRRKDLLTIPRHRKEIFKRSFSYNMAHLINKVNKSIGGFSSYSQVKGSYKQYLFNIQ